MPLFPAYAADPVPGSSQVNPGSETNTSDSTFIKFKWNNPPSILLSSSDSSDEDVLYIEEKVPERDSSKRDLSSDESSVEVKKSRLLDQPRLLPESENTLMKGLENLCFVDVTPSREDIKMSKHENKSKKKIRTINRKDRYFSKFKSSVPKSNSLIYEDDIRKRTEEFNVELSNHPSNVDMWLDYVSFQDSVIAENKPKAEKKISILEKALEANPGNGKLYDEMFSIMETYYDIDRMEHEVRKVVKKEPGNLIAWKWLVRNCLYNVSKVKSSTVTETFTQALTSLLRAYPNDPDPILDLFLEYCIFLRQAGLLEHLWMLIEKCLELNLSSPGLNAFKVFTKIPEKHISEMEEKIITCGLPLGSIWLRMEFLRESYHFLPLEDYSETNGMNVDNAHCDTADPQRIVLSSDIANLIPPVHSSGTSRLISIILTSLKVPMLPSSHCSSMFIGLDHLPWAIESPEFLLAARAHPYLLKYPSSGYKSEEDWLYVSKELLTNPQYLANDRIGSAEFFNSVNTIFDSIIHYSVQPGFTPEIKTALSVWLMRWWMFCERTNDEHVLGRMKILLKEMSDSLPVFTDNAILMYLKTGQKSFCKKIFATAVQKSKPPLSASTKIEKNDVAYLYKTYMEYLFIDCRTNPKSKQDLIMLLANMTNIKIIENVELDSLIPKVDEKMDHISKELLVDVVESLSHDTDKMDCDDAVTLYDLMIPPFLVSWMACHAIAKCLNSSPWCAASLIQSAIDKISNLVPNEGPLTVGRIMLEGLYEILIHILHSWCLAPDSYPSLRAILNEAAKMFPNNLYVLYVASAVDVIVGKWWSVSPVFYHYDSVFMKLFTVLLYREKIIKLKGQQISADEKVALQSRIYKLIKGRVDCQSNKSSAVFKRCPLLWKLMLQFVAVQHPSEIKATFYKAVDMCPWVKSVYFDAAKILPEEMSQIQDLLIEKELRIHITSEELEILRQGSTAK